MRKCRSVVAAGVCVVISATGAAWGVSAQAAAPLSPIGRVPEVPAGARVLGTVPNTEPISAAVTLNPADPTGLASYANAVSTPGSGAFRDYLSVSQFRARFAPSDSQIAAVRSALSADGLTVGNVTANGMDIDVSGTAAQMSTAFATSFDQVRLRSGRVAYANTSAPKLPLSVAGLIQGVLGLDSLQKPQPDALGHPAATTAAGRVGPSLAGRVVTGGPQPCAAATTVSDDDGGLTADQLASAYDFSPLYGAGDEGAGVTIGLFEEEGYRASDLSTYDSCYGGLTPTVTTEAVDGGSGDATNNPGSGESILDLEAVVGLAPQAHVIMYTGPDANATDASFIDIYEAMVADDTAQVLSTSWYVGPCDPYTPAAVTDAEASVFEEAAVQGQSFFNASGETAPTAATGRPPAPRAIPGPSFRTRRDRL